MPWPSLPARDAGRVHLLRDGRPRRPGRHHGGQPLLRRQERLDGDQPADRDGPRGRHGQSDSAGHRQRKAGGRASWTPGKGWFIRLENAGEKVVSSPRVYGGVVYFTTYTPTGTSGIDPQTPARPRRCAGWAGCMRSNYKTGAAVHDFSSDRWRPDRDGHTVALGKQDRSLSSAPPSRPPRHRDPWRRRMSVHRRRGRYRQPAHGGDAGDVPLLLEPDILTQRNLAMMSTLRSWIASRPGGRWS